MKTSYIVAILAGLILVGGIIFFVSNNDDEATNKNSVATNSQSGTDQSNLVQEEIAAGGELTSYSAAKLASSTSETNILFFHAEWCVVCKSVERNLEAGVIPEGITIFKVDFDSNEGQDLADKYNIPIQYTMVQVDSQSNEITQWVNQSFFTIKDVIERVKTS